MYLLYTLLFNRYNSMFIYSLIVYILYILIYILYPTCPCLSIADVPSDVSSRQLASAYLLTHPNLGTIYHKNQYGLDRVLGGIVVH